MRDEQQMVRKRRTRLEMERAMIEKIMVQSFQSRVFIIPQVILAKKRKA